MLLSLLPDASICVAAGLTMRAIWTTFASNSSCSSETPNRWKMQKFSIYSFKLKKKLVSSNDKNWQYGHRFRGFSSSLMELSKERISNYKRKVSHYLLPFDGMFTDRFNDSSFSDKFTCRLTVTLWLACHEASNSIRHWDMWRLSLFLVRHLSLRKIWLMNERSLCETPRSSAWRFSAKREVFDSINLPLRSYCIFGLWWITSSWTTMARKEQIYSVSDFFVFRVLIKLVELLASVIESFQK